MTRTQSISLAGGHAHRKYLRDQRGYFPNPGAITTEQKDDFINNNTRECKAQGGKVSKKTCEYNLARAIAQSNNKDKLFKCDRYTKCLTCKHVKKAKTEVIKKIIRKKACKTFFEFGDLCTTSDKGGWAKEVESNGYSRGHYDHKEFCSKKCAGNYHHLKNKEIFVVDGTMYRWSERRTK